MLVVERSSIGADILCLMVPESCLVVMLLLGISGIPVAEDEAFAFLRVVKALDSDIFAESMDVFDKDIRDRYIFFLPTSRR